MKTAFFEPLEKNKKNHFSALEEKVLAFWKKKKIFERSLEKRAGAPSYVFYDGPPFATGLPHYGHLLASTIKDVIPRYFTMKGHYVERRFGWDCHGLPVEMELQKALGLSDKAQIINYGVGKFNEACRAVVLRYAAEWEKTITRLGRWVDFKNDYKTMNRSFMESVWWVFKQLYDKGLIYRGFKVVPYSWKAGTILSNFEANLEYRTVNDQAVTVKFPLTDRPASAPEYLLAWTTTPWTLPSNLALAVGEELNYVKVRITASPQGPRGAKQYYKEGEIYYLGEKQSKRLLGEGGYEVLARLKGKALVGRSYAPPFEYAKKAIKDLSKCFKVWAAPYVDDQEGVGIVHLSPCHGEEDYALGLKADLPFFDPVDEAGNFEAHLALLGGLNHKAAEKKIIQILKEKKRLFQQQSYRHSYPFCWRTDTPLMYKAISTWFVKVSAFRTALLANNEKIHWVPAHLKHGRFGKWLEGARDWAISRNRYWGTPLPLWEAEDGELLCFGTVAELEAATGEKVEDLHKHLVDELVIEKAGKHYRRVKEVLDCWFESGAMPYAQEHYPFKNKTRFEENFPADFISEGLDQTRGWFYTLLVISTGLFGKAAFKNVITSGLILAEDGKKMSKKLKNYPNPKALLDQYGADAIRAYLLSSNAVKGETLRFSETELKEILKTILLPLWNAFSFFITYARIDGFNPEAEEEPLAPHSSETRAAHALDRWLVSLRESLIKEITVRLEGYELHQLGTLVARFLEQLTNTYIRRNRRRFWKSEKDASKQAAYRTLYETLKTLTLVLAPFTPFIAETLYQALRRPAEEESVHFNRYPRHRPEKVDLTLEEEMRELERLLSLARRGRARSSVKIRQPLAKVTFISKNLKLKALMEKYEEALKSELNIKTLGFESEVGRFVDYQAKLNFVKLGKQLGSKIKPLSALVTQLSSETLAGFLETKRLELNLNGERITLGEDELEIRHLKKKATDLVSDRELSLALDTKLTTELRLEGKAREWVHHVQQLRKELGLDYEAQITLSYEIVQEETGLASEQKAKDLEDRQEKHRSEIAALLAAHEDYLKNETIAVAVVPSPTPLAGPPRLLGTSEAGAPLALRLKVSTVLPEKSEG